LNRHRGFATETAVDFARALSRALVAEHIARQPGLLQSLDPRVRLVGLLSLVIVVTLSRKLMVIGLLFLLAVVLAVLSRVSIVALATRVWLIVLGFTGVIALPALFLTPGDPAATLGTESLVITRQGIATASLLVARVQTAVTFTTLLVLCTGWIHVLKALRTFGLPPEVILMLAMTHRYIYLLVEATGQMLESRLSRTVGVLQGRERRRMTTRTAGVVLSKSITLSNEVFLAMQSRGFRGDVQLLAEHRMGAWDYLGLVAFLGVGVLSVWAGR